MIGISRRLFLGGIAATIALVSRNSVFASNAVSRIKFMTEDYPPFNYTKDGKLQGISVDILVELFKRTATELTRDNIELLSWARGYNLTLNRENHALFSTTRTAERENLFKWVGPFATHTVGLTARKESGIKVNSNEDLQNLRIGVVKDDVGHLLLRAAGVPDEKLDIVLTNESNYKKLIAGRVDVISYAREVTNWGLINLGENILDYEFVYELHRGDLYLALNTQIDDAIVRELQSAFDSMVADGTHERILTKHLGQV